jgi:hypothetical protein
MAGLLTRGMLAAIAGCWLYSAATPYGRGPSLALPRAGKPEIPGATLVVTQVPLKGIQEGAISRVGESAASFSFEGSQIILVFPDGTRRPLVSGFASTCDPEVSFDGTRILFAAQRDHGDPWRIFETSADGTGLRQITQGAGNHRSPLYLSTLYTLISEKPWHEIAFVSDLSGEREARGMRPADSLYSCRMDGTGTLRLTFTPNSAADPFLLPDGRLLFSVWRPSGLSRSLRRGLFAVNIDGTDFTLFSDEEGSRFKSMPCATRDDLVVFVEAEAGNAYGAGTLGCVSLRRNLHSYRPVTRPQDGLFYSPSPLPDGKVVVSRKPAAGRGTFGVYQLDPDSGESVLLFDDPGFDDLQPRLLAPRVEPDGRSTSVLRRTGEIDDPETLTSMHANRTSAVLPSGTLYCLNAYDSRRSGTEWLPPGTVRRVRVLEGVPPKEPGRKPAGSGSPSSVLQRRFIGEAPVEEDGSFNVRVPAAVPIEIQLLDSDGLALDTCSWIWVQNNESRGCIGCHEDGERVPENRLVQAVARPSVALTLPPERRRTVDFLHDVAPLVASRCRPCHDAGSQGPALGGSLTHASSGASDWIRRAYRDLLAPSDPARAPESGGKYVVPGRARASTLTWHLLGRKTTRPWDRDIASPAAGRVPASVADHLPGEERRTVIEWIDTGAAWDNRGTPGGPASQGKKGSSPQP